jgi:hypothetical protein
MSDRTALLDMFYDLDLAIWFLDICMTYMQVYNLDHDGGSCYSDITT